MQKALLQQGFLLLLCILQLESTTVSAESTETTKTPVYISLGEALVLNLMAKRLSFLQIKADIRVADADAEALIKPHIPAIRHQMIILLSEQKARDLKSPAKREKVRQMANNTVKQVITDLTGDTGIIEVLFSSFLVQ